MAEAPHLRLLHLHLGAVLGFRSEAVRRLLLGLLALPAQFHGTHHFALPARVGLPESLSGRAVQYPARHQVRQRGSATNRGWRRCQRMASVLQKKTLKLTLWLAMRKSKFRVKSQKRL